MKDNQVILSRLVQWAEQQDSVRAMLLTSTRAVPNAPKIDFTLWPVELLRRIVQAPALPAELDVGYRVLLDKDRLTEGMKPPTYSAYIPAPLRYHCLTISKQGGKPFDQAW